MTIIISQLELAAPCELRRCDLECQVLLVQTGENIKASKDIFTAFQR